MELFIALGAILALDVIALEFGFDSRRSRPLWQRDQALAALRPGDFETCRVEIARMERDIARGTWRTF